MFCSEVIFLSINWCTWIVQLIQVPHDNVDDKMKIFLLILLAVFYDLIQSSESGIITGVGSVGKEKLSGGLWKSKLQWKAHWVKDWELKKYYVPIWRKVWAPVDVREWIPLPNMPPKLQAPNQET